MLSLDDRGRITLPKDIRKKLNSTNFIVSLEDGIIHLVPVPDPHEAKASVEIPWSIEELEESQESIVLKRDAV
jgi:AbrB family looped-hinge helix DNA binding protein